MKYDDESSFCLFPWLLCISLLAFEHTASVILAADCDSIVATAVSVQGRVEVRRVNVTQWQPVSLNEIFCARDRIRVGDRSRADIALANRAVLRLDQNTAITLGGFQNEQTFLVDLIEGPTYIFSRATRALEVRTDFVNASVDGTEGLIRIGNTQTEITILDGKVWAAHDERRGNVFTHLWAVGRLGKMTSADITNSRQAT